MEKLLISFLSIVCISCLCHAQAPAVVKTWPPHCDCSDAHVRDSLEFYYIDSRAAKYSYNVPEWTLYCDTLIAICPNIATAYRVKAIPLIKNGAYAAAFFNENKAVELDPRQYMAYRGFLKLIFTKDYEGAILDFREAEKLRPGGFEMDHTYAFFQGLCNLELKNYAEAEKNFQQDMLIQSSGESYKIIHFNTLLYTGILYYEMNKNEQAKSYFQKCLSHYKELPEANFYLAMIYKREHNKALTSNYLQLTKDALNKGYGMNEDNMKYAYYPHEITLYEVEEELGKINK